MECAIYVRGLVEYDEVRATMLGQKRFICPHKDLTIGQSRETVLKFLRDKQKHFNSRLCCSPNLLSRPHTPVRLEKGDRSAAARRSL
jgi:hypothetical protein